MVGGLITRAMSFGDFCMYLFLFSCPSNAGDFCFFLRGNSARDGGEQDGVS